jgi:peptidoglycan/LPS O-acetylase OafA/YrhL
MSWVILGHTYYFGLNYLNNLEDLKHQWQHDVTFQVVASSTLAVDSFFVMSGLLGAGKFLSQMESLRCETEGSRLSPLRRFNWIGFYLHRYLRLTVPYLLVLGTYQTLFQYFYEGPRYPQEPGQLDPQCSGGKWVLNALYVNNLVDNNGTFGVSWVMGGD